MRIIISDSSCLIDLYKASLIEAFIRLPYEIAIPDVLLDELLSFDPPELALIQEHLRILSLPGEGVVQVQSIARQYSALSVNDCFALVLAERTQDSILLTGDRKLRELAQLREIEVHGVLWAINEMHTARVATTINLYNSLLLYRRDPAVHLPSRELSSWIRRYRELLQDDTNQ